ncbi:hypothetical protein C0989_009646, partial [Termitomyces sp. Mn162]
MRSPHILSEVPDDHLLLRNQMIRLSPARQAQQSQTSRKFSTPSHVSPGPRSESVRLPPTIVTPSKKSKQRNRDDFVRTDRLPRTGRLNYQPTLLPKINEELVLTPSARLHNSFRSSTTPRMAKSSRLRETREDGKSTPSNDATQPSVPFARRLRGGAASDNGGGSDVEDEEDNDEDNEDNDDGVVYDSDDIGPTLRRLKDEILALRSDFDVTAQRFGEPGRRKALVQRTFPFKVPQGREVRTEQHNDTMRVVRKEMRSLLGTKKDREFPNIVSERPELLAAPRDV